MKRKITKIILGLLLTSNSVLSQIPTHGLVGYWPFNGNANDESGNGNNGTVSGAELTTGGGTSIRALIRKVAL